MKIFYNSSLFRSGGTLIQNILAQNPNFYCTPSSGLKDLLRGSLSSFETSEHNYSLSREVFKKSFYNFIKEGFKGYASSFSSTPYFLDKSQSWNMYYPLLKDIFGEVKMLYFVRDLRSVFSSFEKNIRKNPSYSVPNLLIQDTENRIGETIHNHQLSIELSYIKQRILEKNFNEILFIKYEDFTLNPHYYLSKIYSFFSIPEYSHDLNHISQLVFDNDDIFYPLGDHKIYNSIQNFKIDYKEILGEDISNKIYKEYEWYFKIFNYKE